MAYFCRFRPGASQCKQSIGNEAYLRHTEDLFKAMFIEHKLCAQKPRSSKHIHVLMPVHDSTPVLKCTMCPKLLSLPDFKTLDIVKHMVRSGGNYAPTGETLKENK